MAQSLGVKGARLTVVGQAPPILPGCPSLVRFYHSSKAVKASGLATRLLDSGLDRRFARNAACRKCGAARPEADGWLAGATKVWSWPCFGLDASVVGYDFSEIPILSSNWGLCMVMYPGQW